MLLDLGYKREDLISAPNKDNETTMKKKNKLRVEAISKYIELKKKNWLSSENFLKETRTSISGKKKADETKAVAGYKTETKISKNILKDSLPSVVEFAVSINVSQSTLYNWADENAEFKELMDTLILLAEMSIKDSVNKGLMSDTFGKFILSARHNHKEKTDITSNEETLNVTLSSEIIQREKMKEKKESEAMKKAKKTKNKK